MIVFGLPPERRVPGRTIHEQERLKKEIMRRTRVATLFPKLARRQRVPTSFQKSGHPQ